MTEAVTAPRLAQANASFENQLDVRNTVLQQLYHQSMKTQSMPFHKIRSHSAKAPFVSCTPGSETAIFADLALSEWCHGNPNCWAKGNKAWLSVLCSCGSKTMLVRPKGTQQWYFILGDCEGVACLGWPAVSDQKDARVFRPSLLHPGLHWIVVLDEGDFEAVRFVWRSSSWLKLTGSAAADSGAAVSESTVKDASSNKD